MAPEVFDCFFGKEFDGRLADIFSLGVVLFIMRYANFPFKNTGDKLF